VQTLCVADLRHKNNAFILEDHLPKLDLRSRKRMLIKKRLTHLETRRYANRNQVVAHISMKMIHNIKETALISLIDCSKGD
jgi:hypothetical protein